MDALNAAVCIVEDKVEDLLFHITNALSYAQANLAELSKRSAEISDGLGAARVSSILMASRYKVRVATFADAEAIWHWRNSVSDPSF